MYKWCLLINGAVAWLLIRLTTPEQDIVLEHEQQIKHNGEGP